MVLGEGFPHFRERLIEQLQIEQLLGRIQTFPHTDRTIHVVASRARVEGVHLPDYGHLPYLGEDIVAEAWGDSNIEALTNLADELMKLGHKRFEE